MEALLGAVRELESEFYRADTAQVEYDCQDQEYTERNVGRHHGEDEGFTIVIMHQPISNHRKIICI